MGFTWIYIMLAAEHPKFRNHRGENISRAFFFQRQQSSASTPRSRMVPRWLYSTAGENNRKQLLHSKTMLAKYFTGSLHICFLTSQKGVGFIEESELLCPCHEHLETSKCCSSGRWRVRGQWSDQSGPTGGSLSGPSGCRNIATDQTRDRDETWLLDLSRLQSQRESVETCAGWLLYCRKLRATQPPDFSPSNAAMPAIWVADIPQKK